MSYFCVTGVLYASSGGYMGTYLAKDPLHDK
jgi:hypothetical protein